MPSKRYEPRLAVGTYDVTLEPITMTERMNRLLPFLPASVSGTTLGVITLTPIKEAAMILVSAAGIVATILAAYWNYRVSKAKERSIHAETDEHTMRVTQIKRELCDECRDGKRPKDCIWPENERPPDCPHAKHES